MTARRTAGFSLVELLISVSILGVLLVVATPNYVHLLDRADDMVARAYVRHVVHGVEIERLGGDQSLPARQSCAALAGQRTDPASVANCTYQPSTSGDAYTVTTTSITGARFHYDGREIVALP